MGIIDILTASKQERKAHSEGIKETIGEIREGYGLPALKLLAGIKWLSDELDAMRTEIMPDALAELAKHGKTTELYGFKFTEMEGGAKWKFDLCNDQDWNRITDESKRLDDQRKQQEGRLKWFANNPEKTELIDEETGEIFLRPQVVPFKASTTTIKIEYR